MVGEQRDRRPRRAAAQLTRCDSEASRPHRRRHGAASVHSNAASSKCSCPMPTSSGTLPCDASTRLLEDESLVDRVTEALAQRHPQSPRRGRLGTPAAVVLRMLVLKHLYDWSFDECEREVRGSLVYRAFCRIDGERVPDAKTLIRLAHVLDPTVLKDLLARLVMVGRAKRIIHGRRLRVDTTVVETNIHYPTDSHAVGRWGARAHAHPAAARGAGAEADAQRRAPGLRDRPAQSHRRPARQARGARAQQGADEGALPGAHGDRRAAWCARRGSRAWRGRARRSPEQASVARDDRVGQADRGADPRPGAARRYALSGQGRQSLRAAHRDHPQGQAGQTHGVRTTS